MVVQKYINANIELYPNKVLILLVLLYEYWVNEDNQIKLSLLLCEHRCGDEMFASLKAFIYYKRNSIGKKDISSDSMADRLHLACQSLSFGNEKWFERIDGDVKNLF